MVLKNHIAYRFLTDPTIVMEMIETFHPKEFKESLNSDIPSEKVIGLYDLMGSENQKAYYVTDTVLKHFDSFSVRKIDTEKFGPQYDWSFFKNLEDQKATFIFSDNTFVRLNIKGDVLHLAHVSFKFSQGSKNEGNMYSILLYVDMKTGELCEHFQSDDAKRVELFIYKLLAFFYLSDNETVVIEPGRKYGTQKSGKLINTLKEFPITVVNSKWNITSIRTEGFEVKGHFALRWTGEGRSVPKMVFIQPFKKEGYVRKAKNSR